VNERVDLAIDTASDDVAVALVRGGAVLAERRWRLAGTASEELLGGVDALLREAGVARDEIAAIAVNVGPGGYGGLRTGVATAQGLALALDVPLAGVSRLEADAYPHLLAAPEGAPVAAAHDAGRAGVAWAAYALPDRARPPAALVEPRIDPVAEAARAAPAAARWCGELTPALRRALAEAGRDPEAASGDTIPRAAADLVRLARLHAAYGDPALVDVVYLRPPPITRPRR